MPSGAVRSIQSVAAAGVGRDETETIDLGGQVHIGSGVRRGLRLDPESWVVSVRVQR